MKIISTPLTIVCLCGSTRFVSLFDYYNIKFTLEGKVVLSISCVASSDDKSNLTPVVKAQLDLLHKHKILISDEVFIINENNYIGESTQSELDFARSLKKVISFHSPNI